LTKNGFSSACRGAERVPPTVLREGDQRQTSLAATTPCSVLAMREPIAADFADGASKGTSVEYSTAAIPLNQSGIRRF
jgi:hypothetical protein